MQLPVGVGRVAVVDEGESGRRALRAVRELGRVGQPLVSIALVGAGQRRGRFAREADETAERDGDLAAALRASRADLAWLGPAPLADRLAFAEACARAGVRFAGPPAAAIRRVASEDALAALAAECGVAAAPPVADSRARLLEVIVARDGGGGAQVLGVADVSLRRSGRAVLAESPPPALDGGEERAARELAQRACAAAGWTGVAAVRLRADRRTGALALDRVDAFGDAAPAVEAATGVDLARLALRLAAGGRLDAEPPRARGHAFAARIEVEEPAAGPPRDGATVELLRLPSRLGVRADAAVDEGDDAPRPGRPVATIATRGEDRDEAAVRLEQALADADVVLRGATTNKSWLLALCGRAEVRSGDADAASLEALAAAGPGLTTTAPEVALVAAAIRAYDEEQDLERERFLASARRGRPQVAPSSGRAVDLRIAGARHRLEVRQTAPDRYRVVPAGAAPIDVRVERVGRLERRLFTAGRRHRVLQVVDGLRHMVEVDGVPHWVLREAAGLVTSPMPAVVVAIPVSPGQEVRAGEPVARIESMKVELEVRAPEAGVVREVLALPNTQVHAGAPLLRVEPIAALGPEAAPGDARPAAFRGGRGEEPSDPRAVWLARLDELRRLLLGFDVAPAEARRLASAWSEGAPDLDPELLSAGDSALRYFADVQSLFRRVRLPDAPGAPPPLEQLWRYLHEPEERGEGLSAPFLDRLRRALSHYGVSLDAPGRALEYALLRLQKSYVRTADQVAPIAALLERRLAAGAGSAGSDAAGREVLDRLVEVGQERFPPIADLARELRYRRFDQPAFERARADAYAQVEADLGRIGDAAGADAERIVERLVECTQPLATLLVSRLASFPPGARRRLVEALLRRYYRVRALGPATALDVDGVPCAFAEYDYDGRHLRVVAAAAPLADASRAARALARAAAEAPPEAELVTELYLAQDRPGAEGDALATALHGELAAAGFPRPVRRAAVVVATAAAGLSRGASQQHFTFRGGPGAEEWAEDRRYRGVHPMLFERMHLSRLSKFDLERLPSVEDVYLYRGVAQGNPKDERLFAAANVRDLTPVRDASGRVVQLPHLERMLHEALAGMRLFQARRPPGQRLEWNRVLLTVEPPLRLSRDEVLSLAERLAPATEGLGLEMVLMDARVPDPDSGELRETLLRVVTVDGGAVSIRWDAPTDRPLEPMAEYQQRVVQLRRRGLMHPFELVRMLAPPRGAETAGIPPGEFVEHDLDPSGEALVPVQRPPGKNRANIVAGIVTSFTERYPEGMRRVVLLGDPSRSMGSLAEPECRIVNAALAKAAELKLPVEWYALSAGALISMQSGTENMDWISLTLRRLVEFTQAGGEINLVITGITVGGQPYWNAEATMLMHCKGILVMTPGSSMVLTGKDALEFSGAVSAEDNLGIGGYDRIMGPNGQAQYRAESLSDAVHILLRHYDHAYVAPGERFPRRARTDDPIGRDVRSYPHGHVGGTTFDTVGDIFDPAKNGERKKPFDIRRVMSAAVDQDHAPLERWRDLRGGDTAVVWDAHVGGWPVCMIGIESRPLPRLEFVPADGPEFWSAGTLFPQSSKKIARAINSASGNRPLVVLANLSGFDGSPESMRRLQLEYGAEIGRSVVNFDGPIVFVVVSRYHGGAFVVFSKTLTPDIEVVAIEGARASVIGGAPAAAVVFAREVETRARKDPRVVEAEKAAAAGGAGRARLAEVLKVARSEQVGKVAEEFDQVHTVERALKVGSLDRIIAPAELRPYLVDAIERGVARHQRG
jgi:acetyl/propionyl-CoA carboxylase alpha subunit/acetyl-CoA carboxylase carboxyltransferase component